MTMDDGMTGDDLTAAIQQRDAEIERLREAVAALEDEVELKSLALRGTSESMGAEIERLRALVGDAANEQVEYLDKNSALEAAVKRLQDRIAAMERDYKTLRDGAEEEVVRLRKLLRESADAERDHYATQVSVLMKSGWYRRVREELGDNPGASVKIGPVKSEIVLLRHAIGMLTTLHPKMEIDVLNPIGMAERIVVHVRDEIERLNDVIDRTAKAWLSIEGIAWEGDVADAMAAAVAEIERLRAHIANVQAWEQEGKALLGEANKFGPDGNVMIRAGAMFNLIGFKHMARELNERCDAQAQEIERLRGLLDGLKASHLGYQEFAESEFIKLRELLRLPQEIVQEVDPGPGTSCLALIPAGWWRRVREALGDVPDA